MSTPGDGHGEMDAGTRALLEAVANLSHHHREHEKYYGEAPLGDATAMLQMSRALKALAERWTTAVPASSPLPLPYAGAPDLNDPTAIETAGILFMESGEAPAELGRIVRDLQATAADAETTGTWLASAMEASWAVAAQLVEVPGLEDLLAERHSIIAHDWQNASLLLLIARQLRRACDILGHVDFSVAELRADLAGSRRSADLVFSAAELIDQAVDLGLQSSTLVRQNERRWRVFHRRVSELLDRTSVSSDGQSVASV